MKNYLFLTIFAFLSLTLSAQTVYRVNNNPNLSNSSAIPPNSFSSLTAAISAASNGDIIYIEPSPFDYGNISLSKSLIFIGSGYFLDGTNGNANLQENTNLSTVEFFSLNSGSEGSKFIGLNIGRVTFAGIGSNGSNSADILIEKCRLFNSIPIDEFSNNTYSNISIRKCFFTTTSDAEVFENSSVTVNNLTVENCIFEGRPVIVPNPSSTNIIFRNNTADNIGASGVYVANNIFISSTNSSFNTCVVRNNVFISNQPDVTVGPLSTNGNNLISQTLNDVIVDTGSTDGRFQLVAGTSPAIDGGVEIGPVKPDCGAFGGPDPYILSGIPDLPTIYEFSLPNGNSVPAGTSTIDINFSTRSNN